MLLRKRSYIIAGLIQKITVCNISTCFNNKPEILEIDNENRLQITLLSKGSYHFYAIDVKKTFEPFKDGLIENYSVFRLNPSGCKIVVECKDSYPKYKEAQTLARIYGYLK